MDNVIVPVTVTAYWQPSTPAKVPIEPLNVPPKTSARLKVAVTDWFEFIVTVHAPVPEHAPPQPVNVEPVAGVAVSVTCVPAA